MTSDLRALCAGLLFQLTCARCAGLLHAQRNGQIRRLPACRHFRCREAAAFLFLLPATDSASNLPRGEWVAALAVVPFSGA